MRVAKGRLYAVIKNRRSIRLIRTHLAILLAVLIGTASLVFPRSTAAQVTSDVTNTKAKVQTLSANLDQQVEVKFRDKTKVKGHITAVEPVSFTLRDTKTGTSQRIAYSEVDSVSKAGGISTKTWLIIGGVAAGVVTTWLIVKPAFCDGGAQTRGIC